MGEELIRPCTICGAFDVATYDEVKALGRRCVDREACEGRRAIHEIDEAIDIADMFALPHKGDTK